MQIVSAGMHRPFGAGIEQTGLFCDGECVHVCPQQDHLSAGRSKGRCQAGLAAFLNGISQFLKFLFYICFRFVKGKAGFRVGMQPAPVLDDFFLNGFGLRQQCAVYHKHQSFCSFY